MVQALPASPASSAKPTSPNTELSIFEQQGRLNSKGGQWIFADQAAELAKKVESNGYSLDLDGARLTLSRDGKFLTKWGKKK
jgi:hypothetical protein